MSLSHSNHHAGTPIIVLDQGMVNQWINQNHHKEDLGLKDLARVHNHEHGGKLYHHKESNKSVKLQNLSVISDLEELFHAKKPKVVG